MSLDLTLVLRAETAAAKAELEAAARGIQGVSTATDKATASARAGATAAQAEAAARRSAAQASQAYTRSTTMAAGATGNLVAQFNDIGMMMAAGQNPLQLAIQQGTQVSQVIGPMGAAGAARALGGAFLQMLNPLSLVTLGVIAAGAATVQWLTGADEKVRSFDDAVSDLSSRADSYIAVAERARSKTAELRAEFGDAAEASRQLFDDMAERGLRELIREITAASQDLQAQIGIFEGAQFGTGNQKTLADMFDLSIWSRTAREEINTVLGAFSALDNAGTLDEQIAAAEELKAAFTAAAMASGDISAAEDAILGPLDAMIQKLLAARAEQEGTRQEFEATASEARILESIVDQIAVSLAQAAGISLSGAFTSALGPADQLLGKSQAILATIGQALADFAAAPGLAYDATGARTGLTGPDGIRAEGWGGGRFTAPVRGAGLPSIRTPGGAGSGGGAAARDEADALQELIDSLEGEIAALRQTNPVQQEMLKYREALAGATEAERLKVEELIATREREAAAMEAAQERAEFFEDTGAQALDAMINKGATFNEVLKQIGSSLIEAAIQAAIFGEGPFGDWFGGTSILAGIIPGGKAAGGMIYGPGTGTSDSILTPLSNGEFVVNAKATARNRQLLEAINAGGRIGPGRADGGPVGSGPGGRSGVAGRDLPGSIYIDLRGAQGDMAIEEKVRRGAAQVVSLYDREGLAVSVQRVSRDPKRRG